jgi:hypothetical protein
MPTKLSPAGERRAERGQKKVAAEELERQKKKQRADGGAEESKGGEGNQTSAHQAHVPVEQVPQGFMGAVLQELRAMQEDQCKLMDMCADHLDRVSANVERGLQELGEKLTEQPQQPLQTRLPEQQVQAPPLPTTTSTNTQDGTRAPVWTELPAGLQGNGDGVNLDVRTAAADIRQKIRGGATVLEPVTSKLDDAPMAVIGAMIMARRSDGMEYWLQVIEYRAEERKFILQVAADGNMRITLTIPEMARVAVATLDQMQKIAAEVRHRVSMPDRMVGVRTSYDHTDLCVYMELVLFSSNQVQHSFRLATDGTRPGTDSDVSGMPGGKPNTKKPTMGEAVFSRVGRTRGFLYNFRGKELGQQLAYPVYIKTEGGHQSDYRSGGGRYTAITQDIGEEIATTFGCRDVMYCRTVTAAEAKEASETKTATPLPEVTWDTDQANDAFRNWLVAVDMVFSVKDDMKEKLWALPEAMTEYVRERDSLEPGLNAREFARKYYNVLMHRMSHLLPNVSLTEEALLEFISEMVVTTTSPVTVQAKIAIRAEFEADVVTLMKKVSTKVNSGAAQSESGKQNKAPGKKAQQKKTQQQRQTSGGGYGKKVPCYLTYTNTGCDYTDCKFDHSGRELTTVEKNKLRGFILLKNKDKPEGDKVVIRESAL